MTLEDELSSELRQETLIAAYQAYRERIAHEDSLISQRMSWFVTMQSFLFVSFAILSNGLVGNTFLLAATVIALFSTAVSLSFWLSLRAANAAVAEIEARWLHYQQSIVPSDSGWESFMYARRAVGQPWFRDANVVPLGVSLIWFSFLALLWTLDTSDLTQKTNELDIRNEGEQQGEKPPWEERPGPMIDE